jgi:hypothetical protein
MDSFKNRLLNALSRLLTSKKTITLLVGLIATYAAKKGWVLEPDMVEEIIALFGSLIIAQGAQDFGKEGKRIEAAAPKVPEQVNIQNVDNAPPAQGEQLRNNNEKAN